MPKRYRVGRKGSTVWTPAWRLRRATNTITARARRRGGPFVFKRMDGKHAWSDPLSLGQIKQILRKRLRTKAPGTRYGIRTADGDVLLIQSVPHYAKATLPPSADRWHPTIREVWADVYGRFSARSLGEENCRNMRGSSKPSQHSYFRGPPAGVRAMDVYPTDADGNLDQSEGDRIAAHVREKYAGRVTVIWRDGGAHDWHLHIEVRPAIYDRPACMGGTA